jgi:hypothetical protein
MLEDFPPVRPTGVFRKHLHDADLVPWERVGRLRVLRANVIVSIKPQLS